ncbi:MAG: hypothetical protein KGO02_24445 [Alphaproteobacteria bacterium]|nr:hypothetical protein [Alphaproteobacteria bacterium]
MRETFPQGSVIFCDDIRQEIGGKSSFMGTYFDQIYVGTDFPAVIPKLCVFITFIESIDAKPRKVTINLFLPGDAEDAPSGRAIMPFDEILPRSSRKTATGKDAKKIIGRLAVTFSPLNLKQAGELRVVASHENGELELGKIEIVYDPKVFASPMAVNAKARDGAKSADQDSAHLSDRA